MSKISRIGDASSLPTEEISSDPETQAISSSKKLIGDGVSRGTVIRRRAPDSIPTGEEAGLTVKALEVEVMDRVFMPRKTMRPHLASIMSDSYVILQAEMDRLRAKAINEGLNEKDSRKFQILNEQLVKLAREEREQDKADNIEGMTDDDLKRLAASLIEGE